MFDLNVGETVCCRWPVNQDTVLGRCTFPCVNEALLALKQNIGLILYPHLVQFMLRNLFSDLLKFYFSLLFFVYSSGIVWLLFVSLLCIRLCDWGDYLYCIIMGKICSLILIGMIKAVHLKVLIAKLQETKEIHNSVLPSINAVSAKIKNCRYCH